MIRGRRENDEIKHWSSDKKCPQGISRSRNRDYEYPTQKFPALVLIQKQSKKMLGLRIVGLRIVGLQVEEMCLVPGCTAETLHYSGNMQCNYNALRQSAECRN